MRHLKPVLALVLSCMFPLAAQAQEAPAATGPVVLNVDSGSVMVSQQGAEFVAVESDVSLQPEDRVLVPEGSTASLDYGNGCVVRLVTGAYPVAASCPLAAASAAEVGTSTAAGTSSTAAVLGVGAGVAAVAALASSGGSSSSPSDPPAPPVSR